MIFGVRPCYRSSCVLLPSVCWSSNHQCGCIRSKEVIKLKEVIGMGLWSDRISVLIREDTRELTYSLHHTRTQPDSGCLQSGRASPGAKRASSGILGIQPPWLWENQYLLFKQPAWWYCYGSLSRLGHACPGKPEDREGTKCEEGAQRWRLQHWTVVDLQPLPDRFYQHRSKIW